ncbi:hypothetical protein [Nocardiopsis composta]|uniref:Uncharacterized protein n=1 Tax=Nocardiopsis composta TaxID=157465 RepID=A0A7W8QKW7_9ACTN|nr:hypothetical protein [Nocardiopsis composta]MBB5431376.1 hypothetical protein [Nocardiopsis composta]
MGVRLMVEILDHWSDAGLTSGERSDLLVIAENANDATRETFGSIHAPYILRRAGKSPAAWKNAIGKLMKKKALEYAVRADGREITGYRGQVAVYRIPGLCPMGEHRGLWGQCTEERVTSQVTQSGGGGPEKGHLSDDPSAGKGHPTGDPYVEKGSPDRWERVTSQVTPTPTTPSTSSNEEGEPGDEGLFPGLDAEKAGPKKTKKSKNPATFAQIEARKITDGYFAKYGAGSGQTRVSVRKIVETTLDNGADRDTVAWAIDAIGRTGKSVTAWRLTDTIADVRARRGETADSMASQRTAARCTEHRMVLPCGACRGEIGAGDLEIPLRLLAEHGPEVRWDLAHLERKSA